MELNLVEALILIALDDEKGRFIADPMYLSYGIGGAVILELSLQGRIEFVNDRVKVINASPLKDLLLDTCLNEIKNTTKDKRISHWISKFGHKSGKIKKEIIQHMVERGVLEVKEQTILWVFTKNNYPAQNSNAENAVREQLKAVVLQHHEPDERDVLLLSLIDASKLTKEVFGVAAKERQTKNRIKQLVEGEKVSKSIKKAIAATLMAINAAIMASTVSTTVS